MCAFNTVPGTPLWSLIYPSYKISEELQLTQSMKADYELRATLYLKPKKIGI